MGEEFWRTRVRATDDASPTDFLGSRLSDMTE